MKKLQGFAFATLLSVCSVSYATDNFAVYSWNDSLQKWTLEEQQISDSADNEQQLADDTHIPESQFTVTTIPQDSEYGYYDDSISAESSTPSEDECKDDPKKPGCKIVDFPTEVVTTVKPTTFTVILTTFRNVFSGGGSNGGHGRPVTGRVLRGDRNLTCANSNNTDRAYNALETMGKPYQRGIYLVRYADGTSQTFAITAPLFSDGGIQPVSRCSQQP